MIAARWRRYATGYAFILPWMLGLTFLVAGPFLAAGYFSLCDYPPLKDPMYIGTANYAELLTDPAFGRSLGVTMLYAAGAIPLGVLLAMTLAMLLNARIRGQAFYRVIFYLPHLVPTVVVAILWMWIFNPKAGLLNFVIARLFAAGDWWTGHFFDVPALRAGKLALAGGAGAGWLAVTRLLGAAARGIGMLAVATLLGAATWSPLAKRIWPRQNSRLRQLVCLAAIVAIALAALPLISAALHLLCPADMQKLRSPGWLTDGDPMPSALPGAPSWALWSLIIMSLWGVGQMAVIYLAKLQDVPAELYEAAEIDGANWWRKTLSVTIPMISPVILFNVVMAIIGAFQVFAEPYIMTGGGPEDKTRFVAMFVYDQAFRYHRLGYSSAVAAALFVIIVILTLVAFRVSRKHVHYSGR
jgi:ABC-type sugar transport system permease subunit